jgi:hypothetical protein
VVIQLGVLLASHQQRIALLRQLYLGRPETRDRHADAILVLTSLALGAYSARLTSRFGYSPPMFGERGYHMHYGMQGNAVLNHPMMDMASGFMLSPMRAGIRLATGAEFAWIVRRRRCSWGE